MFESDGQDASPQECFALVILWSAREPERVGEVALLSHLCPLWVLGRAHDSVKTGEEVAELGVQPAKDPESEVNSHDEGPGEPVRFFQQHPDSSEGCGRVVTPPRRVKGESISRRQLELSRHFIGMQVRNVGRCQLAVNGRVTQSAIVQAGDTLYLSGQLLLYCTSRPFVLPRLHAYPLERVGPFGQPDAEGLIGESPSIWALRDRLAACARSNFHVLIIGESGSGKELAARAIHNMSRRSCKKLVADNIATIPPGLAAALLFGNKKNFPNPGMEEHLGLIGAANGSTLFLDEIGDMPEEVQPLFLRVADRGGEYFRLGDQHHSQSSDFRLVGATNHPEKMRYELKRRFEREVRVPSLNERKEDIPLLVQHLLRSQAQQSDSDILRFFADGPDGRLRIHPRLIEQLIHHRYQTNVSEIGFLLGRAMADSTGDTIRAVRGGLPAMSPPEPAAEEPERKRPTAPLPSPLEAQRALDDSGGHVTQAAAALGISRDQLNRMISRENLILRRTKRRPSSDSSSGGTDNL